MIRVCEKKDIPAIKELWGYCFGKEEPFYSWYFQEYFDPNNCLGVFEEDTLQCCLQIPPYHLKLNGASFEAPYVVGVATPPEYRNKGLMKKLLAKTLEEMDHRNQFVSILMPFDSYFYQPYGWELCYNQLCYEIPLAILKPYGHREGNFSRIDPQKELDELNAIYTEYNKAHHGYVERTSKNWEVLLKDIELSGGYTTLLRDSNNQPAAYIQYYLKEDILVVKEIAYVNQWAKKSIIGFMHSHYSQANTLQWYTPSHDHTYLYLRDTIKPKPTNVIKIHPFMCGRVVNVKKALEHCGFDPSISLGFTMKIQDEYAPWNNKHFAVSINQGIAQVAEAQGVKADLSCSINTFSQLFFGAIDIEEALFTEAAILYKPELLNTLSQIFYKKKNYINEYF